MDYNISVSYIFLQLLEMKYIDLQKYFEKLKVFSIKDLKLLDDKFEKAKLSSWIKK
jgi:hypothetical protein